MDLQLISSQKEFMVPYSKNTSEKRKYDLIPNKPNKNLGTNTEMQKKNTKFSVSGVFKVLTSNSQNSSLRHPLKKETGNYKIKINTKN